MNKKKIIFVLIGLIITIASLISNFVFYKSLNHLTIVTPKDSYAYEYAKRNLINTVFSSDSDLEKLTTRLEEFDYNVKDDGIEITGYQGISSKVVIPKRIKNKKVTNLNVKFPEETKSIVVSNDLIKVNEEYLKDIEIYCYEDNIALKENKNLNINLLNDSDMINFDNSSEMFSYDIKNNKVTINNYLGDSIIVAIPETIKGYEVENIEFDATRIKTLYIPSCVKNLSSNLTSPIINKFLVTAIILTIINFILYFIGINVKKDNNLTDVVYSTPKLISSFIYLVCSNILVCLLRINPVEYYKYLIISIMVSAFYLVLVYIFMNVHKNNNKFDREIKQKRKFIEEALSITDDENLIEKLKYSDPVSIEAVSSIEEEIIKELKTSKDNKRIEQLIENRNRIIINNK